MHPGGDLGAGSKAKPGKDVGDVVLDCLGSHEKPLGNLRVRQPFREQWNDIALATAQYLEPAAARGVSNSAHAYAEVAGCGASSSSRIPAAPAGIGAA